MYGEAYLNWQEAQRVWKELYPLLYRADEILQEQPPEVQAQLKDMVDRHFQLAQQEYQARAQQNLLNARPGGIFPIPSKAPEPYPHRPFTQGFLGRLF
jgi:hypothetical protein